MKVRIVKNKWTWKTSCRGWVVVDENIEPIHLPSCPFKTKKNAIVAIKSGRFERDGVTGITNSPIPSWYYETY